LVTACGSTGTVRSQPFDGEPISITTFVAIVRDYVHVELNFARLNEADFRARIQIIHSASQLSGWISPWYTDAGGRECNQLDSAATALPFVDSDGSPVPAPPSRSEKVKQIAHSMRTGQLAAVLVAAYKPCGRNVVLVIDGNHRMRATLINKGALHLVALILHRPHDPSILSDLKVV